MGAFFGFRTMVSTLLVKIVYVLGVLVLTIGGIGSLFLGGERSLFGLLALVVGNLLWRLVCESAIVLFSIHELVGSIEKSEQQAHWRMFG
jgi:hypothetical protein